GCDLPSIPAQREAGVWANGDLNRPSAPTAQRLEGQNARMHALRFRSNQDETKWAHAVKEHAQTIEALQARDGPALRELLIRHLHRKRDAVLEQLADKTPPRQPDIALLRI